MTYSEIEDLIENNLASGIKIPAVDHREVEMALLNYIEDNLPKQFDVKWIYATTQYLGDNFEPNGLGKNLRAGWALMNGNNGTPPDCGGRMFINYGGDFTTLNAVAGEKEHILTVSETPVLDVLFTASNADNGDPGSFIITANTQNGGAKTLQTNGGGLAHNNMPPYITLVAIMKL